MPMTNSLQPPSPRTAIINEIIRIATEVHEILGPGLSKSAYAEAMCQELTRRGMRYECKKAVPLFYKGRLLDCEFRVDLIIEGSVVVEFKTVERLLPLHQVQLANYLKLSGLQQGLLLNFNVVDMKDGCKEVTFPMTATVERPHSSRVCHQERVSCPAAACAALQGLGG